MAAGEIGAGFRVVEPDWTRAGVVFASPHSGRDYPPAMLARSRLGPMQIRSSEDAFVDLLLAGVPALGVPLLVAQVPRAFIDFNRSAGELDPALIEGLKPAPVNARVRAGLGVVPRVVAGGRAIYAGKLTRAEAEARIETYWRPWHRTLGGLLDAAQARHGRALLLDVHSMPAEALEAMGPGRPEVVLGDRFGASAAPDVLRAVAGAFEAEGFRIARNAPFAGAYVAEAYGRPARGRHVVQVEIDRSLYMDEGRLRPHAGFDAFAERIGRVAARIVAAEAGRAQLAAQ